MKIREKYTCPLELTHDMIKGKWKPIILWRLRLGNTSLSQLEKDINDITQKMLLEHLKELMEYGMVDKKVFEGYPLRVEYFLTEDRGKRILEALTIMQKLGIEFMEAKCVEENIVNYYNSLMDENNDPVYDPKPLQDYMDKWDGQEFIEELQLSKDKNTLEIGVGTGRLAVKVASLCGEFTGIDISSKTTDRAKQNLGNFPNVTLICDDFMTHEFDRQVDIIYSSLTFMHIQDKQTAMNKIFGLLASGGRFVLSIDKNPSDYINTGIRKIKVYPDNPDDICGYLKVAHLKLEKQFETEFAHIFVARK